MFKWCNLYFYCFYQLSLSTTVKGSHESKGQLLCHEWDHASYPVQEKFFNKIKQTKDSGNRFLYSYFPSILLSLLFSFSLLYIPSVLLLFIRSFRLSFLSSLFPSSWRTFQRRFQDRRLTEYGFFCFIFKSPTMRRVYAFLCVTVLPVDVWDWKIAFEILEIQGALITWSASRRSMF